jgi:hypothetical protein
MWLTTRRLQENANLLNLFQGMDPQALAALKKHRAVQDGHDGSSLSLEISCLVDITNAKRTSMDMVCMSGHQENS